MRKVLIASVWIFVFIVTGCARKDDKAVLNKKNLEIAQQMIDKCDKYIDGEEDDYFKAGDDIARIYANSDPKDKQKDNLEYLSDVAVKIATHMFLNDVEKVTEDRNAIAELIGVEKR